MLATAEATKPKAEKKTPAVKEKKPKAAKTSSHPPYFEMIKEALLALNEKGGSSPYAIAKYMEEKHKSVLPANFRKILGLQLKNSTLKGKLIKIKASFKLSDAGKKNNPKPAAKKPAAVSKKAAAATKATAKKPKAAPAAKKATVTSVGTKRKAVTKKAEGVKKVAPKKAAAAKPKQPKSIKSPAAKKTKRVKA
ncbi:histone H1 [Primulina eburnea]|uniref:histone H1 n=1 Tax=Primulina eburnea TaxID=1245227 RepID=UPI003C6C6498